MHYKNGRLAQVGDKIVGRDTGGMPIAGVLVVAYPGSGTCNGQVLSAQAPTWCVTIGDCLHVDDAFPKPVSDTQAS